MKGSGQVLDLSRDLTRTLRRLRRDLRMCTRCQQSVTCPLLQDFNQQVQAAIDQINDEWNQLTTIYP